MCVYTTCLVNLCENGRVLGWVEFVELSGIRVQVVEEGRVVVVQGEVTATHHIRVGVRAQVAGHGGAGREVSDN